MEVHSLLWTVSEGSMLFFLVQVSAFSLSDLLRLWLFVQVRSPALPLSTMMLTSLLMSLTVVPSTLSPSFLTKSLSWLWLARLRMTTRPRQLLVHSIWLTLPCSHSGSGSVAVSLISSLPNINISSHRCVKSCHRNHLTFTYQFLEILGFLCFNFLWFACINLVSLHMDCHSSLNAQVDFDSHMRML